MYYLRLEGCKDAWIRDINSGYESVGMPVRNRSDARSFDDKNFTLYVARRLKECGNVHVEVVKPYWFFGKRERIFYP